MGGDVKFPSEMMEFAFTYTADSFKFDIAPAAHPMQLSLCTPAGSPVLPCALDFSNTQNTAFASSIACSASTGCKGVSLSNIQLGCSAERPAQNPAVQVSGSGVYFTVEDSTISGCHSLTDGGFVRAYDQARVSVKRSTIQNCRSGMKGGAICARGSVVTIEDSHFLNDESSSAGGAFFTSSHSVYPASETRFSGLMFVQVLCI